MNNGSIQQIRRFLEENFLLTSTSRVDDAASLLEAGIVDSTGVLELVAFVEETFHIRVHDDEIVPENFDSIRQIAGYVERKVDAVPVV